MKLDFIEIDESEMNVEDLLAERGLQLCQVHESALVLNDPPAPKNPQT